MHFDVGRRRAFYQWSQLHCFFAEWSPTTLFSYTLRTWFNVFLIVQPPGTLEHIVCSVDPKGSRYYAMSLMPCLGGKKVFWLGMSLRRGSPDGSRTATR